MIVIQMISRLILLYSAVQKLVHIYVPAWFELMNTVGHLSKGTMPSKLSRFCDYLRKLYAIFDYVYIFGLSTKQILEYFL